jgi:cytochrome c oxidase cbb3-type subunit 3
MDLLEIIGNGRPQKGMPVWSRTLRPVELAELAAYVGTLRGTNVPGRPPQGNRLTLAAAAPAAAAPAAESHASVAPPRSEQ